MSINSIDDLLAAMDEDEGNKKSSKKTKVKKSKKEKTNSILFKDVSDSVIPKKNKGKKQKVVKKKKSKNKVNQISKKTKKNVNVDHFVQNKQVDNNSKKIFSNIFSSINNKVDKDFVLNYYSKYYTTSFKSLVKREYALKLLEKDKKGSLPIYLKCWFTVFKYFISSIFQHGFLKTLKVFGGNFSIKGNYKKSLYFRFSVVILLFVVAMSMNYKKYIAVQAELKRIEVVQTSVDYSYKNNSSNNFKFLGGNIVNNKKMAVALFKFDEEKMRSYNAKDYKLLITKGTKYINSTDLGLSASLAFYGTSGYGAIVVESTGTKSLKDIENITVTMFDVSVLSKVELNQVDNSFLSDYLTKDKDKEKTKLVYATVPMNFLADGRKTILKDQNNVARNDYARFYKAYVSLINDDNYLDEAKELQESIELNNAKLDTAKSSLETYGVKSFPELEDEYIKGKKTDLGFVLPRKNLTKVDLKDYLDVDSDEELYQIYEDMTSQLGLEGASFSSSVNKKLFTETLSEFRFEMPEHKYYQFEKDKSSGGDNKKEIVDERKMTVDDLNYEAINQLVSDYSNAYNNLIDCYDKLYLEINMARMKDYLSYHTYLNNNAVSITPSKNIIIPNKK